MSWTTIIFEYLAIGIMTLVWVLLVVLRIENIRPATALTWLREPDTATAIVMLGLVAAYSVGMVVDKVVHCLSEWMLENRVVRLWRIHFPNSRGKEESVTEGEKKETGRTFYRAEDALIEGAEGELGRLQRRRGRIRMLRALLLNVPLILVACVLHYWAIWPLVLGVTFEGLVLLAFCDAHKEYVRMIARRARRPGLLRGVRAPWR